MVELMRIKWETQMIHNLNRVINNKIMIGGNNYKYVKWQIMVQLIYKINKYKILKNIHLIKDKEL